MPSPETATTPETLSSRFINFVETHVGVAATTVRDSEVETDWKITGGQIVPTERVAFQIVNDPSIDEGTYHAVEIFNGFITLFELSYNDRTDRFYATVGEKSRDINEADIEGFLDEFARLEAAGQFQQSGEPHSPRTW